MYYGKKKSFGGMGGGYRGSSYIPIKDPLNAYRQVPQGEDEYHRKLRHSIEKDELRGPEHFFSKEPHYKTNFPTEVFDSKFSEANMKEFRDSVLKQVLEEINQERTEVTPELYNEIKENTNDVTEALGEILNNPSDETSVLDFTKEMINRDSDFDNKVNELNSQLDDLNQRMDAEIADTKSLIQDINEILPDEFSRRKNPYDSEFDPFERT